MSKFGQRSSLSENFVNVNDTFPTTTDFSMDIYIDILSDYIQVPIFITKTSQHCTPGFDIPLSATYKVSSFSYYIVVVKLSLHGGCIK